MHEYLLAGCDGTIVCIVTAYSYDDAKKVAVKHFRDRYDFIFDLSEIPYYSAYDNGN